jgi:SynChlorMet cassette radical SAM/SPASM protein ScmE/SynChlorMet cassette protein ScmD
LVLREEFENTAFIFDPRTGETTGINAVSALIFKCLDGRHTLKDILEKIENQFENVPGDAAEQVNGFIQELTGRGLAEETNEEVVQKSIGIGYVAAPQYSGDIPVMRTPRSVDVAITHRCNLRCTYCSHFSSAGDVDRDLPLQDWLKFFEELATCGVMRVTLQGGEPLCRDDFRALIRGIVDNRMRFSMLSNGTLVTDDLAGFLVATGRCDGVQVSIDGPSASAHDAFRGQGSFDRAVRGITCLQKNGMPASVRVTIHRHNFDQLREIARFLLQDLQLPEFSTNAASYMGLCRENMHDVQMSAAQKTQAMADLLELCHIYPGRISASAGPLADVRHWRTMAQSRSEGRKSLPGGGYLTGCGCTMQSLAVRADGVLIPCIQLSHIELGRINADPLERIWHNHPNLHRLRERRTIPLHSFSYCKGCNYIPYCTGNCPALAYSILGNLNHPSPDACFKQFIAQGGELLE